MNLKTLSLRFGLSVLISAGIGQAVLSEEAVLSAQTPGSQINIRARPTVQSNLLHYGLSGDAVEVLEQQRVGAYTWYRVEFPRSKARGWVRGDLIRLKSSLGDRGIIQGELIYPSGFMPGQKICAENIGSGKVFCTETGGGETRYALEVDSGRYHVYAQACNQASENGVVCRDGYFWKKAFYNEYVRCGLNAQCARTSSRNPIVVRIDAGKVVNGINPQDWYGR